MYTGILCVLRWLAGRGSLCRRVGKRLRAYAWCDTEFTEIECLEVERHLAECGLCARQFEHIMETGDAVASLLYPDEVVENLLPPLDTEGMAKCIAARIERGEEHSELVSNQSLALLTQRIRLSSDGKLPVPFRQVGARWRYASALAACALLLVVAPVLAYFGQDVWGWFDKPETSRSLASIMLDQPAPPGPETPQAGSAPICRGLDGGLRELEGYLDAQLASHAAHAKIKAMLPKTEAEYEAWARREYPHIMWLHDVLQGQTPRAPADSPAGRLVTFGMTDEGNPTITFADADDNRFTLCLLIEPGDSLREPYWQEETELGAKLYMPVDPAMIPWDGVPAYVPEWAQNLYAGTPEHQRPTGWRALLVYSAEIFKFDWPESLDMPDSRPRLRGLAALADFYGDETGCCALPMIISQMPDEYPCVLSDDPALTVRSLTYLVVAAGIAEPFVFSNASCDSRTKWDNWVHQARGALTTAASNLETTDGCMTDMRATLNSLFVQRQQFLERWLTEVGGAHADADVSVSAMR